jgi:hypothetical protein
VLLLHVAEVEFLLAETSQGFIQVILTSIRTVNEHDFYSLDFFRLVKELQNLKMMRADKVRRLLC